LTNSITVNKFDFFLRNVYFGEVTDPNTGDANGDGTVDTAIINGQTVNVEHPVWGGKVITDLSVGYNFTKSAKIVVGANNLFDVYPDENLESLKSSNQFTYSRNVSQFGQNGRFLFARLSFSF
jgi:iron complex outermembrane receptor protein